MLLASRVSVAGLSINRSGDCCAFHVTRKFPEDAISPDRGLGRCCFALKSSVAKHHGCKRVKRCGLILQTGPVKRIEIVPM